VKKNSRIGAAGTNQSLIDQGRRNRAISRCDQFVSDCAEAAAIRRQALAGKRGYPFLGHQ